MSLSEITRLVIEGAKKTGSYYATYPTKKEGQMTREDIIRMAREAGLHLATDVNWMPIIDLEYAEKFAALVAAAEREACAKVCEDMGRGHGSAFAEFDCVAAIRARGEK